MIDFDAGICADLSALMKKEWLETNGLGGYASSTIACLNTRRYHALLVAAQANSAGVVLLSKLEETLIIGDERIELSTNQYPQTIHPKGYRHLQSFRLDPFPVFTFRIGAIKKRKLFYAARRNTTVVRYEARGELPDDAKLEVRPLVAFGITIHCSANTTTQTFISRQNAALRASGDKTKKDSRRCIWRTTMTRR
jgi:predicted glycogen debranching enzyme